MTIDDQAFHDFTNMSFEKMTLLGAPLVPGPAVDMVLQSKANDLERAIRRLSILHFVCKYECLYTCIDMYAFACILESV